jgi:hypothetical protein
MNHKRRRPKNRRAGCLMCKPHKMNGAGGSWCQHRKQMRADAAYRQMLRERA